MALPPGSITRLAPPEIGQGAAVLAGAFHADPIFAHAIPDSARRARVLPWLFATLIRYGLLFGEVYTTPSLDGVAIWLCPSGATLVLARAIRAGMLAAPFKLGWAGLRRFIRIANCSGELHEQSVFGQHWYLFALGVEPSRQGRGIGSALMQPVLARADTEGLPCYLDTAEEVNVAFYEKRGFGVTAERRIPDGPHLWAMVREPGNA